MPFLTRSSKWWFPFGFPQKTTTKGCPARKPTEVGAVLFRGHPFRRDVQKNQRENNHLEVFYTQNLETTPDFQKASSLRCLKPNNIPPPSPVISEPLLSPLARQQAAEKAIKLAALKEYWGSNLSTFGLPPTHGSLPQWIGRNSPNWWFSQWSSRKVYVKSRNSGC